ncbi:LacI family DNA-binding transcriptional regulator [Actinoplanes couchii]|uniref:LacI family transcriptional regulator n=1 Tax=Actinoplanes couchii TaxID=403638 RepID=A0ABQ3XNN7_9ACTN|nr:LacI family DNA-binding transcriptional regulator [Actinoplanes couchii]MDR6319644.1 LacI family transcriptional regulator [Actinoplanes couchii]GID60134.1 LacI family transcriptional regulator [Actinoplanes couchii]
MPDKRRVTAREVATLAGVSPGTVSKALTGKGAVHPDTRDRILRAAREMGLHGLPEQRDLTVGLITRNPFDRRNAPVMLGVLETFAEHDIAFLVCDGRADALREQFFVDSLRRRRVDGILVAGSSRGSYSRPPLRGVDDLPVVYMVTTSTDPDDVSVVPDNRGGAELAVRHLLSTGRRRIAAVLGPGTEEAAALKTAATRDVLAEHGLDLVMEPLCGDWTEQWGRQATYELLHNVDGVDGIVCGNDMIARGVIEALQSRGVVVPDDTAVIGFDNWSVMVEGSRPRLSSIDLNLPDVGRTAAARMVEAIRGATVPPGRTVIESRLVPHESTALP